MLLQLSEEEIEELQSLQELFDDGDIELGVSEVSFTVDLAHEGEQLPPKQGVYGFILEMYYNKIPVTEVDVEYRCEIQRMLVATNEFWQSVLRFNGYSGSALLERLVAFFE